MIEDLEKYYKKNGISAVNFNCKHYYDCKKDSLNFTKAKEATVGEEYEKGEIPRLLFISLDSGSAEKDPRRRTLEYNRKWQRLHHVYEWDQYKHWYKTHQLASCILGNFKEKLKEVDNVRQCFAHTNSAKCCENNPSRAQASSRLFKNCREYIPGEVIVLSPNIVITQGAWAREAIETGFEVIKFNKKFEEVKVILVGKKPALWIHTYHPRNGYFNSKNLPNFHEYGRIAYKFVTKNDEFLPLFDESQIIGFRPEAARKSRHVNQTGTSLREKIVNPVREDHRLAIEMLKEAYGNGNLSKMDCPDRRTKNPQKRRSVAYQIGLVLKANGDWEKGLRLFREAREKHGWLEPKKNPEFCFRWAVRLTAYVEIPEDQEFPETYR